MKILIAPDSFKGNLTANEFCKIAAQQIHSVKPEAQVISLPMADGGEGTIDAILASVKGQLHSLPVYNPLAKIINAQYAILDDEHIAVIEMARASGLPLIEREQLNPMRATSYGTGELILDALDQGCRRFIIGLGGSATNDGGTGMLQALGVRFIDSQNRELHACGQTLSEIDLIDLSDLDSRIKECEFIIAGDVTNPLLGECGATFTFGPQKGADGILLQQLEAGMQHYVNKSHCVIDSAHSIALAEGSGAAGGMGFALMAYCQATMQSGFELIADLAHLDNILKSNKTRPDLIISGEGRFDSQSLHGKLPGRLVQHTEKYQIPVAIICGSQETDLDLSHFTQNIRIYSLCSDKISVEYSMNNTAELIKKIIIKLVKEDW